jgi:glycosyltransferase involved in cell wall biosynthesis
MKPSEGRVVVVGNGIVSRNEANHYFANRHTAAFLKDVALQLSPPVFVDMGVSRAVNADLSDGCLTPDVPHVISLFRNQPIQMFKAAYALLRSDVAYLFFPGTLSRFAARVCHWFRKPYGLYVRGEQFSRRGFDATVVRRAAFVCCVSGMARQLAELNTRVSTVRPMFEMTLGDRRYRSVAQRRPGPWRLLFVGHLDHSKGIPVLIQAFHLLQGAGVPCTLTLIGGGPLFAELHSAYGDRADSKIRVMGVVSSRAAIDEAYEGADILVLPSHHEGFPRVLFEAMLKSTLVITTFVGGIPEVLRDDVDCLRIPPGDPLAILEKVCAITRDPVHMQRLIDGAHITVGKILANSTPHHEVVVREIRRCWQVA